MARDLRRARRRLLPLTGVPAPFLSFGKTSMVTFVLVAAMLARLAEDGRAREMTPELAELRRGSLAVLAVVLIVIAFGRGRRVPGGRRARRADERAGRDHGPRSRARLSPRTRDREVRPAAGGDRGAHPARPLRGPRRPAHRGQRTRTASARIPSATPWAPCSARRTRSCCGPPWMLERLLAAKVRGYPERDDGHSVWLAREPEGGERLLFIVRRRRTRRPEDRARAEAHGRRARRSACCRCPPPTSARCVPDPARGRRPGARRRSRRSPPTWPRARRTSRSTRACRWRPRRS